MNFTEDILDKYKTNRKTYSEKLEYYTSKLDEVEILVDDLMFEIKEDSSISEEELAKIPDENVKDINIKTKELRELLVDTKKVMTSIKRLEGKRKAYNRR